VLDDDGELTDVRRLVRDAGGVDHDEPVAPLVDRCYEPRVPEIAPASPRFAAVSAALSDVDWAALRKRLVLFAYGRCKDRAMASDLAQEALRRLWEPTTSWDPAAEPDPLKYAMSTVNSILWGERVSARAKDVPLDASGPDEPRDESLEPPDPNGMTEDRFANADLAARRVHLLRTRLAEDPRALAVLELTVAGHDAPSTMSTTSGLSYEDVIAARKRLQRAAAGVARDLPDEEPPSRPDVEDEDAEKEVA
jgi:DNA-directed RNA polymerase specialized sigma24 family protein